jgi:hypothetical protein
MCLLGFFFLAPSPAYREEIPVGGEAFFVSASLQGRGSRWWQGVFGSSPAYREAIPVGGKVFLAPQPAYREEIPIGSKVFLAPQPAYGKEIPIGGERFFGFLLLAALYNVVGIMSKKC